MNKFLTFIFKGSIHLVALCSLFISSGVSASQESILSVSGYLNIHQSQSDSESTLSSDTTEEIASARPSNNKILPKSGNWTQSYLTLFGTIFIGIALLILWKEKKKKLSKQMMILLTLLSCCCISGFSKEIQANTAKQESSFSFDNTKPSDTDPNNNDEWINVTIPTQVIFNTNEKSNFRQIISPDYTISNHSGRPVRVELKDYEMNALGSIDNLKLKTKAGGLELQLIDHNINVAKNSTLMSLNPEADDAKKPFPGVTNNDVFIFEGTPLSTWHPTSQSSEQLEGKIVLGFIPLDDQGNDIGTTYAKVFVKDSSIYVGSRWKVEDNFVSATDKDGNSVSVNELDNVTGQVDTSKPGEYKVSYSLQGVSSIATVTVKEDHSSLVTKDSSLYSTQSWKASDNFVSATDEDGNSIRVDDSRLSISGEVDSETPGEYTVKYTYKGIVKAIDSIFKVTIIKDQTTLDLQDVTLYIGQTFDINSPFKNVIDKDGRKIDAEDIEYYYIDEVKTKTLDTSKPGTHKVRIVYRDGDYKWKYSGSSTVTIKEDQTALDLQDVTLYTGQTFDINSPFKNVIDKDGIKIDAKDIEYYYIDEVITKTLDTSKPGTHKVRIVYLDAYGEWKYSKSSTITIREDKSSLIVKDSSIYVTNSWDPSQNFVSATDKEGNPVLYTSLDSVDSEVDNQKVGEYKVTYRYQDKVAVAKVSVKYWPIRVDVKDSSMYVGENTWNPSDNFTGGNDEYGRQLEFTSLDSITGTVDTNTPGEYKVTYSYKGVSSTATITVRKSMFIDNGDGTVSIGQDKWFIIKDYDSGIKLIASTTVLGNMPQTSGAYFYQSNSDYEIGVGATGQVPSIISSQWKKYIPTEAFPDIQPVSVTNVNLGKMKQKGWISNVKGSFDTRSKIPEDETNIDRKGAKEAFLMSRSDVMDYGQYSSGALLYRETLKKQGIENIWLRSPGAEAGRGSVIATAQLFDSIWVSTPGPNGNEGYWEQKEVVDPFDIEVSENAAVTMGMIVQTSKP